MRKARDDTAKPMQRSIALPPELWARLEAYGDSISPVKLSLTATLRHALTVFLDERGIPAPGAPAAPAKPAKRAAKRKA